MANFVLLLHLASLRTSPVSSVGFGPFLVKRNQFGPILATRVVLADLGHGLVDFG